MHAISSHRGNEMTRMTLSKVHTCTRHH